MFFESMKDDVMLEAMSKAAATSMRQGAAAAVVQWIEDGDSEADAFEAMAYGLAGGDDGDELTDEQAEDFNEYLALCLISVCKQAHRLMTFRHLLTVTMTHQTPFSPQLKRPLVASRKTN
ncbi:hypothetical protein JCM19237_323 [Photobacterium aphoticum]|uniref:Uncharacterized protein n=1 Tax=Photobacterium aphoticum TaxID=754436 RepID=A0A090R0A4_9GAMM|nr:hypothetical protein JCM19237_323 [Photobacterium aphoticum]